MKDHIPALLARCTRWRPCPCGELAVTIDGVKKTSGTLVVTLMNEAAWDGKDKPILVESVAAQSAIDGKGRVTVKFADLPEGSYAVGVIHDVNDNHKLDTGVDGHPSVRLGQ